MEVANYIVPPVWVRIAVGVAIVGHSNGIATCVPLIMMMMNPVMVIVANVGRSSVITKSGILPNLWLRILASI
jgi:hypothetical protein